MPGIKTLVDTSCVLGALDHDLNPSLSQQLPKRPPASEYWSTQYLRMEFLRRWILTGIEVYFYARQVGTLKQALATFSDRFGREPRIVLKLVAALGERALKARLEKDQVESWAYEVYKLARVYDKLFDRYVSPPVTGCKRGEVGLDLDAPRAAKSLEDFYARFELGEHDCKLRSLAANPEIESTLRSIFEADIGGFPAKARGAFREAKRKYARLAPSTGSITCRTCSLAADALIAMEQPFWGTLYHLDHVFDILCSLLNKPHHRVRMPPQARSTGALPPSV